MLALLLAAIIDPWTAAHVGAALAGRPEWGPDLVRIARRESQLRAIGIHPGDAGNSRSVWLAAVRVGWLDPQCQPYERGAWSTRGVAGTMAAFTLHHLRVPCLPPWVLDVPLVAAVAATLRAHDPRCGQVLGCRRWRGPLTAGRSEA